MKKKGKKISQFEKEWNKSYQEAKDYEWDFSLPRNPALGEGLIWTPAKRKAVNGRIVTVGWADSEAITGVAFYDKDYNSFLPQILTPDGAVNDLDGPEQIISIGDTLESFCRKKK